MLCRGCGNEEHLEKDCPKRENGEGKKKVQDSDEEEDESTNLISEYISDALVVSMGDPKELIGCSGPWVLVLDSSHHGVVYSPNLLPSSPLK